jgi:predicted nucleotidyltransferase component of viral defense system
MTLFDEQVARAVGNATNDSRRMLPVIEKEILHHDILRALNESKCLTRLAFFGGTNLRLCHDASRYSEDLDFKGGPRFTETMLGDMSECLSKAIAKKYGLESHISPPKQKEGNTHTWTIQIMTRPDTKSEKQQKIHLDFCSLACYEHTPRLLANHYAIDLGTTGLLIHSQSLRESYTDKLIAVALRGRLMPRDLWDIAWLRQNPANATPVSFLEKLAEHQCDLAAFAERSTERAEEIVSPQFHEVFQKELERFLPERLLPTVRDPNFLAYIAQTVREDSERFSSSSTRTRRDSWEM